MSKRKLSQYVICKDCVNGTGFRDKSRTIICPTCKGRGRSYKLQRGHNDGIRAQPEGQGSADLCYRGHLKEGTMATSDAEIVKYCLICHRGTVKKGQVAKKELEI